jgi:hypothetical protein
MTFFGHDIAQLVSRTKLATFLTQHAPRVLSSSFISVLEALLEAEALM